MQDVTNQWKRKFLKCKDIVLSGKVEPIVLKPECKPVIQIKGQKNAKHNKRNSN